MRTLLHGRPGRRPRPAPAFPSEDYAQERRVPALLDDATVTRGWRPPPALLPSRSPTARRRVILDLPNGMRTGAEQLGPTPRPHILRYTT
jgi:hypothetical protein